MAATTDSRELQTKQIRVASHRIRYLQIGKGSPVVLLHGGASDSQDWIQTLTTLSDRFTLYAPDMPGFGLSSRDPRGYYLSDLANVITEFIRTVGLNSVALVGHSMGGRVSLEMALQTPQLANRLVLVDTMGFGKTSWLARGMGTCAWVLRSAFNRPHPFPKLLVEPGEDYDWICLERLPMLSVPTLIIWNRWDPFFSVRGAIEAMRLAPDATLAVLSGWGHSPHVSPSKGFVSVLYRFLEG